MKPSKHLREDLDKVYRMSITEMVTNIEREIEKTTHDKDEEWKEHVELFHQLSGKLAFDDKPLSADDQVSKLLSTLPTRLTPISMFAETSSVRFENFIASVKAGILRRKITGSTKNVPPAVSVSVRCGKKSTDKNHGQV